LKVCCSACSGGIIGALLAWQLVPLVPRLAANFLPIEAGTATAVSVPVLAFAIALSLLTGLLMGLYPRAAKLAH